MMARLKALALHERVALALVAAILVLVPFHAFLTIWIAHLTGGGYTGLRLWSSGALFVVAAIVLVRIWRSQTDKKRLLGDRLTHYGLAYGAVCLVSGLYALGSDHVSAIALVYGLISNLRFLVFFACVYWLIRRTKAVAHLWPGVVLVPAMLVAFVAILQFAVLPPDVMKHFGYGPQTIDAVETINNNAQYQRVAGTLRGPNPLGAYLLVIITLLVAQWRVSSARLRLAVYILSCGFALAFSFSRSAWLGLLVSGAIVLVASATTARLRRLMVLGIAGFMLITGAVFVGIRDNAAVQNAVFHTEDRSSVALSSNDQREQALRAGLKDVADEPLGRGVGTAGPASVYNQDGPVRIAENYYLQVGQEVGWLGLSLFVALNVVVLVRLWALRRDPLALGVFAAGCGLVVVNMLSHAWTDDTLAYIWWGLAALALSRNVLSSRKSDAKTA